MDYQKIFNLFNKQKVMIIGDVMVDSYLWGQVDRISPEAPVPVVDVDNRSGRLGGAANVALNVKAMGATPIPCAITGKDSRGEDFCELLREQEITEEGIVKSKYRKTTTKFRVIGDKTQMLRVDEETRQDLNSKEQNRFLDACDRMMDEKKPDVVIFEDYDKGLITPEGIDHVMQKAGEMDIPVAIDPKKKNFLNYHGAALFKPNLKEIREGLKLDSMESFSDIEKAILKLQDMQNHALIMVTLSDHGVMISDGSELIHIPAHFRSISDVSGAGDTVISVAALCLAQKCKARNIAELSNLAGGIVCEHIGVVPVNKEQFLAEVNRLL